MRETPSNVLDILDHAYQVHEPRRDWLQGLVDTIRPTIDQGEGALAFLLHDDGGAAELGLHDVTPSRMGGYWQSWADQMLELPRDVVSYARSLPSVVYKSHFTVAAMTNVPAFRMYVDRRFREDLLKPPHSAEEVLARDEAAKLPWAECLALHAHDPAGGDLFFVAPHPRRARNVPTLATLSTWTRIMGHVATAYRLHRLVGRHGHGVLHGAEAILAPDGAIQDAALPAQSEWARNVLRHAAVRMDRARAKTHRCSSDEITEHWRALVAGRWSLLDEFDSDGRRFVVARRNDLAASDPKLSNREQQVAAYLAVGLSNKEIAYQLGVSISTVNTHARRIAQKLGATGRVALVESCARHVNELKEDA